MAIATVAAALVRPVGSGDHKAFIRKVTLGATAVAGDVLALQSDGFWDPVNGDTGASRTAGLAVQSGAAGDAVDIVKFGPVKCVTGATPGATVYADASGKLTETVGTLNQVIGYAETTEIVFVNPDVI